VTPSRRCSHRRSTRTSRYTAPSASPGMCSCHTGRRRWRTAGPHDMIAFPRRPPTPSARAGSSG
jgi:hypothetical protein